MIIGRTSPRIALYLRRALSKLESASAFEKLPASCTPHGASAASAIPARTGERRKFAASSRQRPLALRWAPFRSMTWPRQPSRQPTCRLCGTHSCGSLPAASRCRAAMPKPVQARHCRPRPPIRNCRTQAEIGQQHGRGRNCLLGIEGVLQAAIRCGSGHELRHPLGPGRTDRVRAEAALLPDQTGQKAGRYVLLFGSAGDQAADRRRYGLALRRLGVGLRTRAGGRQNDNPASRPDMLRRRSISGSAQP